MAATLTPDGYRRRATDVEVEQALAAMPAVVIEGPKGCGKTWTGRSFARSEVLFDRDLNARRSVSLVPGVVLEGDEPALLDGARVAVRRPDADFRDVLDALCRGGWPRLLGQSVPDAQLFLDNYIADLCLTDVSSVDGVARDPGGVARLFALGCPPRAASTAAAATSGSATAHQRAV